LWVSFRDRNRNNGSFGNQVVGVTNTGAPVIASSLGFDNRRRDNDDFGVIRAGANFKFNSGVY
jgi:hypothetical protein